jgi:hypothetical protein
MARFGTFWPFLALFDTTFGRARREGVRTGKHIREHQRPLETTKNHSGPLKTTQNGNFGADEVNEAGSGKRGKAPRSVGPPGAIEPAPSVLGPLFFIYQNFTFRAVFSTVAPGWGSVLASPQPIRTSALRQVKSWRKNEAEMAQKYSRPSGAPERIALFGTIWPFLARFVTGFGRAPGSCRVVGDPSIQMSKNMLFRPGKTSLPHEERPGITAPNNGKKVTERGRRCK